MSLSVIPIYERSQTSLKVCFLNARSLRKHLSDILQDLNYTSTGVNKFSETRYSRSESDHLYLFNNEKYTLFRNDAPPRVSENTRPFGGTAVTVVLTIIRDIHNAQTEMAWK